MLSQLKSARGKIIGIDISSIPYGTGVSNYTQNLVRSLLKIDKLNTYKLFYSSLRQPLPKDIAAYSSRANIKIYHYRLPPTFLEFLWNRLHLFPIELFIGKCDVFHTWDWTQPPTLKAKTVTTIHDLVPFIYPESQHPKTIATINRKLYWATRQASHFICVSQNTKADFVRLFPKIAGAKISVIYEAAEIKYDQFSQLSPQLKKQKLAIIYRQYGLKKYLLTQGTREPRKNLDRLIQAFQLFKNHNPQSQVELVISGKYGWGKDICPPTDNSIKILGYIPEKDMVSLHAAALCLCYPSIYEGFGLPLVKSMKVGTPIIAGNSSSIPEVVGNSALLVDPANIQEIANAIEKIVHSATLRRRLINQGYRQAKKFSWVKTAQETLKLYQQLC